MDAKKIIDRINNPAELQNDEAKEWNELTDKHPYFSVGQLLQFGNDYFQEKDNIAFAALYKADPIKFAEYVNEIKSTEKISIKKETAIVDEKNDEVIQEKTKTEKAEEKAVEVVKEDSIVDTNVVDDTEPIEKSLLATPEIVEEEKTKEEKEDILAMINELPNTSVLDVTPTAIIEKEVKKVPLTPSEEKEQREKALMVMMSFTDWLHHFKSKTEKEQIEEQEKKALKTAWQKEKLTAIIEEEQDEIPENIFKQAMDSISIENALISESLAEILAKQGKTDKAIEMYKKLSLRNPKKNSYFADRIKVLLTNNI